MSAVIVTVDLTTARDAAHQPRHRRTVSPDVRAWRGIAACTAVGVAGYGYLMWLGRDVLTYLAGMW